MSHFLHGYIVLSQQHVDEVRHPGEDVADQQRVLGPVVDRLQFLHAVSFDLTADPRHPEDVIHVGVMVAVVAFAD
ncbi:hypothetical protein D3C76_1746980 [compost metagenome]